MEARQRRARVLLVEDNPGDALMTREAFEDARIAVDLEHVTDAEQAIESVTRAADQADGLPDLVLLDLNLPGRSGLEVLRHVRADDRTRHVPVIMLTSSRAPDDVIAAYREYANSFITKPVRGDEFLRAVRALEDYWLTLVRLPSDS